MKRLLGLLAAGFVMILGGVLVMMPGASAHGSACNASEPAGHIVIHSHLRPGQTNVYDCESYRLDQATGNRRYCAWVQQNGIRIGNYSCWWN